MCQTITSSSTSRRMILLRNSIILLVAIIATIIGCYFSWRQFFPTCHIRVNNPVRYTATKSPYLVDFDALPESDSYCSAHQAWVLVRHGTRTPNTKVINEFKHALSKVRDDIVKNRDQGRGFLCDTELQRLKDWQPYLSGDEPEKALMPQGFKEMAGIASRFQKRFPDVFVKPYNQQLYHFKYTKTDRTKDSADAFTKGLFGKDGSNISYPESLDADPILRFYKGCQKWQKGVNKNPATYEEQRLFVESQPFQETLARVSARLGFIEPNNVSKELMITMYQNCAFETAYVPDNPSPWCTVFDEDDFQVIEYYQDLDYYWTDGYGHEITYQSACPAIMDMLNYFANRIQDPISSPNVISYFTHSGTLLKVLARLGLFRDNEHLRHDNFHLMKDTRQWRTSRIGTFATNVAIVLYKCSNGEYQVGLLFREQEIEIPQCNFKKRCSFQEFRDNLVKIVGEKCENEKICKWDSK